MRISPASRRLFYSVFSLILLPAFQAAFAQADPPIPSGHIRIHYFRPDSNYMGWTVYAFGDTTEDQNNYAGGPVAVTGSDSFGAYFDVGVTAGAANVGLILHKGNTKDPGPNEYADPAAQGNEYWQISGSDVLRTTQPPTVQAQDPPIPPGKARIHYVRPDNNYGGWSLYPFGATSDPTGNWCSTEDYVSGYDSYGAYYDVGIAPSQNSGQLGFILHNCSTGVKDPGPDQHLQVTQYTEAWVVSGNATVFLTQPTAAQILSGVFDELQAYWIDATTIAIQPQYYQSGWTYALNLSSTASLQLTLNGITGGTSIPLTPFSGSLTADELARYPQLGGYALLKLPNNLQPSVIPQALKGQLAISAVAKDGVLKYATGLQIFGVLDALFYYPGRLGVVFHRDRDSGWYDFDDDDWVPVKIKTWAPTAQSVSLLLFEHDTDAAPVKTFAMHEHNGVWVAGGDYDWKDKYYQFRVQVYVPGDQAIDTNTTTDPYSIDLGLNGGMSRITDLSEESTKPFGWDFIPPPSLASLNDLSIYELHIRDFSIGDPTVPAAIKGTYMAFADSNSNGMKHLRTLARAGLKAVHIMPSFHFASVNEDKSTWKTTGDLSQYPPDGTEQQQAVAGIQSSDGYNWGYDPVHYMAPAGAYAVNPGFRVREYREMVQGLHRAGLRVIQDVVFNHTSASGETPAANLDEIVPGYYHRLDANGALLTGSCCPDTASEHRMMEKLMTDTLLLNAKQYKIDGFRFDEMSMHFTYNMAHIKNALNALTPEKDGVDGSRIYLYGEGFQIGEAANNALGPNASQLNLYGFGIGTFNDRIRDGVRGGSPFTDARVQGFATGLATDSSDYTNQSTDQTTQRNTLFQQSDWIRIGLTGNLKDFSFTDFHGQTVTGGEINYGGQPAGYTAAPVEAVNYCSVHDNQTLFDAIQLKASAGDTAAIRARRQVLAMSLMTLGQGVPLFLAGDDLLRSKDMDNNSYDSGDWFNKIDFSFATNNWGIGLPVASQNQSEWPFMQPLLANSALKPTGEEIAGTTRAFQEFLRIRYSSGLFRMQTLSEVQSNLSFLNTGQNQIPGLIVMKLDAHGANYGPYRRIVVVWNAANAQVSFTNSALAGAHLRLHPVLQQSSDPVVRQAVFQPNTGTTVVPALTTAVFVEE